MNTMVAQTNQTNSCPGLRQRSRRNGFSLVEILVVLAIIAILATAVGLNRAGVLSGAKRKAAISQIKTLKTALEVYDTDHGGYPTMQQGLGALISKPTIPPVPAHYPAGGYLSGDGLPLDPWGNPFIYLVPGLQGQPFEIISYGKDKRPGGGDDDADISSASL